MAERFSFPMAPLKIEGGFVSIDEGNPIKGNYRPKGEGLAMRRADAENLELRWYVVRSESCRSDIDDDAASVWTLSRTPGVSGWETDSGSGGYGLTYPEARELADAANKAAVEFKDK